ncbi:MFS transporter [Verminephrobacter aporrectodeae subsp. tuberculatae]|uniref:MFS transporter n=1 Tax=Verminephrobacter aporrectodeae TaxID=1110389 RepID=UPI0022435E64|nr:MFS transporter [Verminephrobacter aporrectodeae]MCW8165284.1 MFS transporter [Verminephrobacter aporrectodeae subsp. tuberculatae]MCW8169420.1 MFS transporter [Verminephrobacter aporrectodeae subsp. tuberculatae]
MHQNVSRQPSVALLAQLVVCALAVVSLLYIPLPILPLLGKTYQLPLQHTGLTLQAFGLAYATGFLLFGPLSDRVGRKVVMVGGLLALATITLYLAWVETAELFIAGRAIQGFAAATFPPVALAYLSECGSPRQRVWGVAWMSTAFLSAGLLGQIYGSVVAVRWGFGWALLPLVAIYGVTALGLFNAPKHGRTVRLNASLGDVYYPIFSLLGNPELRRIYLPALLLLMSFVAFYIGLDLHLGDIIEQHGISRMQTRGIALPAFLAPLLAPKMIGRWGARHVASAGLSIAALGLLLCALVGSEHIPLLLAASVVFVTGVAISVPGLISQIAAVTSPAVRGLAVSFYTFVLFVGASLGPWLGNCSQVSQVESLFLVLAAGLGAAAVYSVVRGGSHRER